MSSSTGNETTATSQGKSKASSLRNADAAEVNPPVNSDSNKDTRNNPSVNKKKGSSVKDSSKTPRKSQTSLANSQTSLAVENVGQNCRTCNSMDNSRMVQCDSCDEWHHYSCVGVGQDIENEPWCCVKCAEKAKKKRKSKVTKLVKETKAKETSNVPSSSKNREPAKQKSAKSQKAASVTSAASKKSSREHLKLQLQKLAAEQTLLEEKKKLIEKQFSVRQELADLDDEDESGDDVVDGNSKVKEWLSDEREQGEENAEGEVSDEYVDEDTDDDSTDDDECDACDFVPQNRSTPRAINASQQRGTSSNPLNGSLTRNQLAARQVVAKDLPMFTGHPEEWPMFFSTFESTTRMCGYTDDENMLRLRNCLKGDALATVRSFLLHPSTVRRAIDALKLRFGQPQFIIQSLKDKVLAMPPLRADSMNKLIDFALAVQNLAVTIDACGRKEYLRDVSLLGDIVGKLPASMKLEWARHTRCLRRVNLVAFSEWIYAIAEDASLVSEPRRQQEPDQNQEPRKKSKAFVNTHAEQSSSKGQASSVSTTTGARKANQNSCIACKGACVSLAKCKRFLELSYDGRWATIREARACRKCLKQHKGGCESRDCKVNGCTFKHHPLLHKELSVNPLHDEQACNAHLSGSSTTLFRYVPIVAYGNGVMMHCYAFLDDGSSLTLMDQELADELNLTGEPRPLCLKWTGGTHRSEPESRSVNIDVSGLKGKRFHLEDVRTVKELQLPPQTLDVKQLQAENRYLEGVPVEPYCNVRPRILIGVRHASATLVRKSREGKPGQPIAIKTNLGWTIYGGFPTDKPMNMVHYTCHVCSCEHGEKENDDGFVERAMKEYFSLENLGVTPRSRQLRSKDDERAIELLHELTDHANGRFETGLLWRYNDVRMPDSKPMALKRFHSLERRMEKSPELARMLKEKFADYVAKDYARKLTEEELMEDHERVWYLPVFPVTNPNKPGKLRLVWDAAAKTNGVSLNSCLLAGPDLLTPLVTVLYKFREFRFAICGDIREMFHQVGIRSEDQHSQRFLWRDTEKSEPNVYVMQVMTFGACCSPASAQFIKNKNAERFSKQHPAATKAIVHCTYVDDMLCSTETEQDAIELAKAVWYVHNQGGFEIRNWMSNSVAVLSALCSNSGEEKSLDLSSDLATEKVLGMWWCTKTDCFTYKINWDRLGRDLLEGARCPTKREVLRIMMTIYDPLGLIAHYLMYLKVLMQEIWRTGAGWDDNVDQQCYEKWQTWLKFLPEIEHLKIPRCYRLQTRITSQMEVQLHTFVDASENGMAAVVYLRFVENGAVECSLVAAKSRVAPLKYLTIPRLELEAARIGARLSVSVLQGLSIEISKRFYWSDSRNVLSWIRADHRKYSAFVAARVSDILDLTNVIEWRWVPTRWNVADEGTKWHCRPSLTGNSRWFKGPEFLWQGEEEWPVIPGKIAEPTEELRAHVNVHIETTSEAIPATNFCTWRRLVRATVYVFRFIKNARPKKFAKISGCLTSDEIRQAEEFHLRIAQQDKYSEELSILRRKDNTTFPKRSPLYKLSPYLDERQLLRMHGRTGMCKFLTPDTANPIILPRDHPITLLIVESYHQKFHHQNHESVINEVRQRYCISRLRRVYTKVRSDCQRCKLRVARPRPPAMANLPVCRLAAFVRPFTHTGIDYFGPMEVAIGRRVEKRWGVLLTCLTIRAVYIDIASSLSTSSCVMAIRNFMVRRGTPAVFYSDRGTNFVGSERELKQALLALDQHEMAQELVSSTTTWRFNPPASPHMGGSWERLIQSVKRTLSEFRLSRRTTEEELRNALIEVEGILNARPLTHVPIEDEAAPVLTPNHWLLGSSDGFKPWTELDDNSTFLSRGWHLSQQMANYFWKRWVREYLPEITRRSKWHEKVPPIRRNDIVLIVDPGLPRNCWPKGRVIGTINRDGQVRTVTIQTSKGVYERPAVKVAVLDVRGKQELADSEAESANWGGVSPECQPLGSNTPNAFQ